MRYFDIKFGMAEHIDISGILRRDVIIRSDLSIFEEEIKVY